MREFKFRAWHKETKEMLTGYIPEDVFSWKTQGQPIVIMQFSGEFDTDGKEIYEGDKVFHKRNKEYATVIFDKGKFIAKFEKYSVDLWQVCYELEIRGTIHQKLEL